jgi:predicted transcriptional regulator
MTTTTIKVETSLRDRLAALARDRGTTMGALLAEATQQMERATFFAKARGQLERLRQEDPTGWAADRSESQTWQAGTDRDIPNNRDEPDWWE